MKANATAKPGAKLFLTKPLGVGIVTTAQKRGVAQEEHIQAVQNQMGTLNEVGFTLGQVEGIQAMTDVTGFGLGGHLLEMCEGSDVTAQIVSQRYRRLVFGNVSRTKNFSWWYTAEFRKLWG